MAILTVSQINRYLASRLSSDQNLKHFMIKGEISNFTAHSSGHWYFSLKDEKSVIRAVMFRNLASRLRFRPDNGMKVILSAGVTYYEAGGVCQLNVTDMQPEGLGSVALQLEQRKAKLQKEGLFAESAKKPLPALPRVIGVITSPTGAALQDILNILRRRCPIVSVKLFPVLVQGEQAPDSVSRALDFADRQGCDVLILGRGGGSAEDLQAFNAEQVAYAIYRCRTPVISAVGHEVDFTIADAVADKRAPTPSAAAELSVPDLAALHQQVQQQEQRLQIAYTSGLQDRQQHLTALENRLKQYRPDYRLQVQSEQLRHISGQLHKTMQVYLQMHSGQLQQTQQRLQKAMELYLHRQLAAYQTQQEKLTQLDPLRILQRGYAAVYQQDGALLSSVKQTKSGDTVRIQLADGTLTAKVEEIK